MPRAPKLAPENYQRFREGVEHDVPLPDWTPYVPKPLPGYVQERIDAYRAIPSLKI